MWKENAQKQNSSTTCRGAEAESCWRVNPVKIRVHDVYEKDPIKLQPMVLFSLLITVTVICTNTPNSKAKTFLERKSLEV